MSTYAIYNSEFEQIMAQHYVENAGTMHGSSSDTITILKSFGTFNYTVSNYRNICVSENVFSLSDDLKLLGNINSEMLCLTFMNTGNSAFSCGSLPKNTLNANTYNLFYINNEEQSITECTKHPNNDLCEIYLSKDFFVELAGKYPELFEKMFNKVEKKQSFAEFENGRFINHQMKEALTQIKNAGIAGNIAPLLVESKVLELFSIMLNEEPHDNEIKVNSTLRDKMHEAKYIIEKQYHNPPGVCEIAQQLGICGTTMKEGFKKVFNTTLYAYLFDYRMKKAEQLLRANTELSILDVAVKIGYEHQANFSAAFKRKYGVSPKAFQKRC